MITVEVTTTNYVVSSTAVSYDITVTADNNLFTVTSIAQTFSVTNITPEITFQAVGGDGFNFANKFLGEWISGETYYRNDVVQYEYSTYICNVDALSSVTSTTPPPQDSTNWILFIYNEWPRASLTVTNQLTVLNTATFKVLEVGHGTTGTNTGTFYINGLRYPTNKGVYGQVLYTNGSTDAAWVNLGELVYWQLSEDLQTVGYNIVTGSASGDPNPQLTIGSGPVEAASTASFKSFIKFDEVADAATLGTIRIKGNTLFYNPVTLTNATVTGAASIGGAMTVYGNSTLNGTLAAYGNATVFGDFSTAQDVTIAGLPEDGWTFTVQLPSTFNETATFNDVTTVNGLSYFNNYASFAAHAAFESIGVNALTVNADGVLRARSTGSSIDTYINVSTGFRFPDGTTQSTAFSGTATGGRVVAGTGISTSTNINGETVVSLKTATNAVIGGMIPGNYMTLNTNTGAISVQHASSTTFGVVQIGDGLHMETVPYSDPEYQVVTLDGATTSAYGGVRVGDYLSITEDTYILSVNTSTLGPVIEEFFSYTLPPATTSTLGGIIVGDYLTINTATGLLSINTATLAPALVDVQIPIATTSTLGGIIVGEYLTINTATGLLSINTATLAPDLIDVQIPIASDTVLGGVRIPLTSTIDINTSTGDITVPLASTTTVGVVKIGENIDVDINGVINPYIATTSRVGVVRVGLGLDIGLDGNLTVNTSTQMSNISLGEDMETNGYKIQHSVGSLSYLDINNGNIAMQAAGDNGLTFNGSDATFSALVDNRLTLGSNTAVLEATTSSYLEIQSDYANLQASTQTYVLLTATSITIAAPNTTSSQVVVKAAELIVGHDVYYSQVQASAYYDYSGTGAAFFPANVKFSDDTIQRTAWRGYDQGLI